MISQKEKKNKKLIPALGLHCTKLQQKKLFRFLLQNDCYNDYVNKISLYQFYNYASPYEYFRFIYDSGFILDNNALRFHYFRLESKWVTFYKKRLTN